MWNYNTRVDDILGVVTIPIRGKVIAGTPPSPSLSVVYLDIVRLMIQRISEHLAIELLKCRNGHLKYLHMSG